MLCLWSTTARTVLSGIGSRALHASTTSTTSPTLTAAEISLNAARAVRLYLKQPIGGVEQAYVILNSLRYSYLKHTAASTSLDAFQSSPLIHFDRPVSPRLSSHALLHGLIRMRKHKAATNLASEMMQSGLRLRSKTISVLLTSLSPKFFLPVPNVPLSKFPTSPSSIDRLLPHAHRRSTRHGLQLFSAAQDSHQGNTSGMFGTLLTLCLINGEIILASLLFGIVCKDYHLRKALQYQLDPAEDPEAPSETVVENKRPDLPERRSRERWCPHRDHLVLMLNYIDKTLTLKDGTHKDEAAVPCSLQALANLASLLDLGQIPFGAVSTLLCSLYEVPNIKWRVWVEYENIVGKDSVEAPKEDRISVPANHYFQSVLLRLVSESSCKQVLDRDAFNTLLHYDLRYRASTEHGAMLLKRIMASPARRTGQETPILISQPPGLVGMDTLNILIRNGTLLKREDIVQAAAATFLDAPDINESSTSVGNDGGATPEHPDIAMDVSTEGKPQLEWAADFSSPSSSTCGNMHPLSEENSQVVSSDLTFQFEPANALDFPTDSLTPMTVEEFQKESDFSTTASRNPSQVHMQPVPDDRRIVPCFARVSSSFGSSAHTIHKPSSLGRVPNSGVFSQRTVQLLAQKIADDMNKWGCKIPPRLRKACMAELVGRWKRRKYPKAPVLSPYGPKTLNLLKKLLADIAHRPPSRQEIYMLTTLIKHMVAMGWSRLAKKIVYALFPDATPFPRGARQRNGDKKPTEPPDVHQYAQYGPYLYTILLDALFISGHTYLARKVWSVATKAQVASCVVPHAPPSGPVRTHATKTPTPWVLPVHAYTTMLQCFLLEWRRPKTVPAHSLPPPSYFLRLRKAAATAAALQASCDDHASKVRQRAVADGLEVYSAVVKKRVVRRVYAALARQNGGGGEARGREIRSGINLRKLKFPEPDRNFFDVAMRLFVFRHLGVLCESTTSTMTVSTSLPRHSFSSSCKDALN